MPSARATRSAASTNAARMAAGGLDSVARKGPPPSPRTARAKLAGVTSEKKSVCSSTAIAISVAMARSASTSASHTSPSARHTAYSAPRNDCPISSASTNPAMPHSTTGRPAREGADSAAGAGAIAATAKSLRATAARRNKTGWGDKGEKHGEPDPQGRERSLGDGARKLVRAVPAGARPLRLGPVPRDGAVRVGRTDGRLRAAVRGEGDQGRVHLQSRPAGHQGERSRHLADRQPADRLGQARAGGEARGRDLLRVRALVRRLHPQLHVE